jgi:hypothetical protein
MVETEPASASSDRARTVAAWAHARIETNNNMGMPQAEAGHGER